jgi:hypothetical protein
MGETPRVWLLIWLVLLCYGARHTAASADLTPMVSIPAGRFLC